MEEDEEKEQKSEMKNKRRRKRRTIKRRGKETERCLVNTFLVQTGIWQYLPISVRCIIGCMC